MTLPACFKSCSPARRWLARSQRHPTDLKLVPGFNVRAGMMLAYPTRTVSSIPVTAWLAILELMQELLVAGEQLGLAGSRGQVAGSSGGFNRFFKLVVFRVGGSQGSEKHGFLIMSLLTGGFRQLHCLSSIAKLRLRISRHDPRKIVTRYRQTGIEPNCFAVVNHRSANFILLLQGGGQRKVRGS